MAKTNLMVVGGFLGAGKTTCILSMAKYLISEGKKVGIVTNDQGSQLVDTNFLAMEGLHVLEVAGGCFCCNFDEFTEKVNQLAEDEMPDIILAEPVGSCTDLIATVFKPIQIKYTERFFLSPLSIVVDPKRVRKLMMEQSSSPFPDEINYLFRKQLEEADVILLNKIDLLSPGEAEAITRFLKETFKGIEVLKVSAKNNIGIDNWASKIANTESNLNNIEDIDYQTYGTAEEKLGWLNSSVVLNACKPVDINVLVGSLFESLKKQLVQEKTEIAHLKIYAIADNDWAKASLTSIFEDTDFNRKMEKPVQQVNLIINSRINMDPEKLKPLVEDSLKAVCSHEDMQISSINTECFKPGKPQPRYRITGTAGKMTDR